MLQFLLVRHCLWRMREDICKGMGWNLINCVYITWKDAYVHVHTHTHTDVNKTLSQGKAFQSGHTLGVSPFLTEERCFDHLLLTIFIICTADQHLEVSFCANLSLRESWTRTPWVPRICRFVRFQRLVLCPPLQLTSYTKLQVATSWLGYLTSELQWMMRLGSSLKCLHSNHSNVSQLTSLAADCHHYFRENCVYGVL